MAIDASNQNLSSLSMSNSAIDSGSTPYFIHHLYNPRLSQAIMTALSVKSKLGFKDGSISKPDNNDDLINHWILNNNMVISWILNSVSKEFFAGVIYSEFAHDIWIDLKERYQQRNGHSIFQLRRELMNLTQGQSSVSIYFTKLKTIWKKLNNYKPVCSFAKCNCGGNKKLAEHYHMKFTS
ncbi:uncharacterized protein LOC111400696 [Olea europaea var. sylvestris]|uniref:uncharacterized protein LOC111400696 n=1 Tax=Olea europaea var. sylvestris TaxID=158386 RepID=UPI000C1D68BE|nr:uncharacterized protein LOC111400696 [Olea europaea var. sylvestris]